MTSVLLSQKSIALIILLGIASLFVLCMGSFSMMTMGTVDCPMTHQTTLCPMDVAERLSFWQHLLAPTSSTITILALIALVTLSLKLGLHRFINNTSPPILWYWRRIFEPSASLFDCLKLQFSQGILHPKIY